ncbi:hypothetical protein, partial [Escherichia coli]|uniref:hypothetical protein n=1 Tax=Escherichia coli TaxID=562 RepID=UPI003EDEDF54
GEQTARQRQIIDLLDNEAGLTEQERKLLHVLATAEKNDLQAQKKNYSRSCYRWSICNIPQWSNRKLLLILWLWQGKHFADIG